MGALSVGDKMLHVQTRGYGNGEPFEVVVYKVGRRWAYAKPIDRAYPDTKFDIETGYEDGKGFSPLVRIVSAVDLAAAQRHSATLATLRELGVEIKGRGNRLPNHVVESILELVEAYK